MGTTGEQLTKKLRPQKLSEVSGNDLNKELVRAIARNPLESPSTMIMEGSFGSGKCVLKGTRVVTDQGYRKIEDICGDKFTQLEEQLPYEGDVRVLTTSGWVTPSDVYRRQDTEVVTISTKHGNTLCATPDHRVAVMSNDMQVFFQKMKDIQVGQTILLYTPPILLQNAFIVVTEAVRAGEGQIRIPYEELLKSDSSYRLSFLGAAVLYRSSMVRKFDNGCVLYGHHADLWVIQQVLHSFCMVAVLEDEELYLNTKSTMLLSAVIEQMFGKTVTTGPKSPVFALTDGQMSYISGELETIGEPPLRTNMVDLNALRFRLESLYGSDIYKAPLFRVLHAITWEQTVVTEKGTLRGDVYDLTVPGVHNYTTEGFISHNTTTARILAKALNCDHFTDDLCGECETCKADLDSAPFYAEYDVTAIGNVESVKQLRDTFSYAVPNHVRVIVFDEFQAASRQAQSALLKVFEEAPSRVKFILATTNPENILPTIRSRSLELNFTTLPKAEVIENLKSSAARLNLELSDDIAELIATRSKGHMRNAHMLLDQYRLIGKEAFMSSVRDSGRDILALLVNLKKRNKDVYFQCIDRLLTYPLADLAEDFQNVLLNLLKAQMGQFNDERTQKVAVFYGKDLLNIVRICTQDWMLSSFANDITLQTALLALYQLLAPAPQVQTAGNRNMK